MNNYTSIKPGQYKHDHLSLAMASLPMFPTRAISVASFQTASVPPAYSFSLGSGLGQASALYNPSSLTVTTNTSSQLPPMEGQHINHSLVKPPPMMYHNFTPLNSCSIVTGNSFFSLNTATCTDLPKHSFDDVLNMPATFSTDAASSSQLILQKNPYHKPSDSSIPKHYFSETLHSNASNVHSAVQAAEIYASNKESECLLQPHTTQDTISVHDANIARSYYNRKTANTTISSEVKPQYVAGFVGSSTEVTSFSSRLESDAFKCGWCEVRFSNNDLLLAHVNTHSDLLPYRCGFCDLAFVESTFLITHMQEAHVLKSAYACGLCVFTCHSNQGLIEHIKNHSKSVTSTSDVQPPQTEPAKDHMITAGMSGVTSQGEEKESNDEADATVSEMEDIDQTSDNACSSAGTIIIGKDTNFAARKGPSKMLMDDIDLQSVCTVIIEPSSAGGARKKHLFKCNYCQKVCKDKGSLVSHARTHTKGRPYGCSMCSAKFKQYAHLSDHVMTKHTKDRPFICDRCAKTFKRKSHLQDHIRLRHTDDKLYHCPDCSNSFEKRSEFADHKRTHGKPPKYHCNICPRQFRNVTDYERHIRSHTKEKRFECEVCHLKFGLLANAKKHMVKHNEERPFKCELCPKAYHFEHEYKRHKMTHLKTKPFPCPDCYKSFKNAVLLKRHTKESHLKTEDDPSKKPFKCLTCRKRFRIQWDLDRHKKIHTKKKPFPCLYCYRSYGSEAMLAKHVKVHDGKKLPLYNHSKDLIDDSEIASSIRIQGKKAKLLSDSVCRQDDESETEDHSPDYAQPELGVANEQIDRKTTKKRITRQAQETERRIPSLKLTLRCSNMRRFHCPDCSQVFTSRAMLAKHSLVHDNEEPVRECSEPATSGARWQNSSKNQKKIINEKLSSSSPKDELAVSQSMVEFTDSVSESDSVSNYRSKILTRKRKLMNR